MPAFTTIAAAAGLAATAGSTVSSFAQAGKQRNLQKKAEAEAERAMAEAKKELSINYSAALGIQKEPYQLEREALISAGAQAIEAGREGERGAAETAGRIYALQQQGQQQIASEMGQELTALDKATAVENAQLRNARANLNLAEVEGAQTAAANAEQMGNAFTKDALAGVASTVQQAASFVPLYSKSQSARAFNDTQKTFEANKTSGLLPKEISNLSYQQAITKPGVKMFGVDMSQAAKYTPNKFADFMTSNFTKEQLQQMNIPTTNQFSDMLGFATSFGVGGL
jgi:hypothetical protein